MTPTEPKPRPLLPTPIRGLATACRETAARRRRARVVYTLDSFDAARRMEGITELHRPVIDAPSWRAANEIGEEVIPA